MKPATPRVSSLQKAMQNAQNSVRKNHRRRVLLNEVFLVSKLEEQKTVKDEE